MKYITLESGAFLAGVTNMLDLWETGSNGAANMVSFNGSSLNDAVIAKGMEAPYLFLKEGNGYVAGKSLFQPTYVNHFLQPRGFRMREYSMPKGEVGTFLRQQHCALLMLNVDVDTRRLVVFSGYADRKYEFINLRQRFSFEPETLSLTSVALKNRLDATVVIYTLEKCEPAPVDFIELLIASIKNLHVCCKELTACPPSISQEDFEDLNQRLLQPFMQDLFPVIPLTDDDLLIAEYKQLNHVYRHLLIHDLAQEVSLNRPLLMASMQNCLQYLHEDILDRLYAHGADDTLLEAYSRFPLD